MLAEIARPVRSVEIPVERIYSTYSKSQGLSAV